MKMNFNTTHTRAEVKITRSIHTARLYTRQMHMTAMTGSQEAERACSCQRSAHKYYRNVTHKYDQDEGHKCYKEGCKYISGVAARINIRSDIFVKMLKFDILETVTKERPAVIKATPKFLLIYCPRAFVVKTADTGASEATGHKNQL
jgi:hypothetical protein